MVSHPILELRHISKSFGMTAAMADVSIAILPGQVHAIVGENGAGKSTLIKILTGVHQPDEGEMLVDGKQMQIRSTEDAQKHGIAAIFQEPMVFPDLDVAENIFISHHNLGLVMNWATQYQHANEIIARLGITLDPRRLANGLTLAEQQTVEIARALSLNVRALIMDEPTASLSAHEVDRLVQIVEALKMRGVAVIYISHRLEEIFRIADTVTVMRDGKHISTKPISQVTQQGMVRDMVGRSINHFSMKVAANAHGEKILSVRNLTRDGVFSDVSFDLHIGEVLCFAGLIGSRRTDVGLALFGVEPATSGYIEVARQPVTIDSPQSALKYLIAYVSEDRRKFGLALNMPIFANISLPSLKKLLRLFGLIDRKAEIAMAESHRERLSIRTPNVTIDVGKLSGGNQQKVMLAKWLETEPRILIFDEPTRGIDIGAKTEVHNIIRELAIRGVAIIVISSDLPEVLMLADRVLVMREGRQMGIFDISEATQENIMALATGQTAAMSQ
ncbi:MAG: sugar ABC transporter ATP-binding protein [Alphaproteobacteria bacterium]|nr:sugar ABC transporter ATP-binding protein [Alphaproteobacteria bacterium]